MRSNTEKGSVMIKRLSIFDIASALENDPNANWSRVGALALAEWLDNYMAANDELDIVAVRSVYSEFDSWDEWANVYGITGDDLGLTPEEMSDEPEGEEPPRIQAMREHVLQKAVFIEHSEGVIVEAY